MTAASAVGMVVDASVSAAWILPDEAKPFNEAALQATAERPVWVPALWLDRRAMPTLGTDAPVGILQPARDRAGHRLAHRPS